MKAVILAGGLGTRLSEETSRVPKPMVEIAGKPILWHIMKIYSYYGVSDFIICCGYKGYTIKEYFSNFLLRNSDITFNLKENKMEVHSNNSENWRVTLVDTGNATMTGGRIKRIEQYIDETFYLTYGDGVGNIDINKLLAHHKKSKKISTMTVVKPQGRFGSVSLSNDSVTKFVEKPIGESGWINGGFFVVEPEAFSYIKNDMTIWEREPLEQLASKNELSAYKHERFWQPMDTLRDMNYLNDLSQSEKTFPWHDFGN
jgi:glucose-1-phosphate cytidylyltransferase